jgi:hypothetical protein
MHWETHCNQQYKLSRSSDRNNTGTTGATREGKISRIEGTLRSTLLPCKKITRPAAAKGKKPDRSHGRVQKKQWVEKKPWGQKKN